MSKNERPCRVGRTRFRAPGGRAPTGAAFPALGRRHSCLRLRRRPDPARLLPREELAKYDAVGGDLRVICDVVAAMTDTHLLKTYERLFSPRMESVFDRL